MTTTPQPVTPPKKNVDARFDLTRKEFDTEKSQAVMEDKGKKNVIVNLQVKPEDSQDTSQAKGMSYKVEEEDRSIIRRMFPNGGDLQKAGFTFYEGKPEKSYVEFSSTKDSLSLPTSTLRAYGDGRIVYEDSHLPLTMQKITDRLVDYTEEAAKHGITAESLRNIQYHDSENGELDRNEQKVIIDMLANAKAFADKQKDTSRKK